MSSRSRLRRLARCSRWASARGAEIISKKLGAAGRLNVMIPGNGVSAIFGFCDIRRFTDATECLQENVMVFVNCIAELVHSSVRGTGGFANKNIGDAFLLVWKLGEYKFHRPGQFSASPKRLNKTPSDGPKSPSINRRSQNGRDRGDQSFYKQKGAVRRQSFKEDPRVVADGALRSFVEIIETISKSFGKKASPRAGRGSRPLPIATGETGGSPGRSVSIGARTESTITIVEQSVDTLGKIGEMVRTVLPDWAVDMGFGLHVVGGRGGHRHRAQGRRVVPLAARQHGVAARGGDQAVRRQAVD